MVYYRQLSLRALQFMLAACVLGFSETLVQGQVYGVAPATTHINSFSGAFGVFVSIIGILTACIDKIPTVVMLVLDTIAVLFYFSGSIAYAVELGVHSCTATGNGRTLSRTANPYTQSNYIIDAGTYVGGGKVYVNPNVNFEKRCHLAHADTAVLFLALVCFIGSLSLDIWSLRGKRER